MISKIYRYPHPHKLGVWIYVGQTCNLSRRDRMHRSGKTSFGRRFKSVFPNAELPTPDFREVDCSDSVDLNEEETIDIFRYHTWHGQGGMNLVLPGSLDYRNMGKITANLRMGIHGRTKAQRIEDCQAGGRIGGRKQADLKLGFHALTEEQHLKNSSNGGKIGGKVSGRLSVESGRLAKLRTPEHQMIAARLGGLIGGRVQGLRNIESGHLNRISGLGGHNRWHARRGIVKSGCKFCLDIF